MWVSRQRYDELVRAEERAEWFCIRINQLEQQVAGVEFKRTGIPQAALEIVGRAHSSAQSKDRPDPRDFDPFKDMPGGVVSFEDMGDAEARKQGYSVDEVDGAPAMR